MVNCIFDEYNVWNESQLQFDNYRKDFATYGYTTTLTLPPYDADESTNKNLIESNKSTERDFVKYDYLFLQRRGDHNISC